ncbi:unnamed protein product [Adineta ricciae]|uniref:Uncharacterized protein n=1 Tax=Adineta ricciae TaxID=249248 RepID=A0A814EGE8_ADIRI|nr:unnamed protein product [Adineta ricciae]CAF1195328.1 unnamed protein product [Adineta ricciae]
MESERIEQNHQDEKDDSGIEQDNSFIYIRISVEDHNLQKVLKFNFDDTVWSAKQKVLQVLVRELTDPLNFGLYLPPCNGRAGKFLDESRCLREYPLNGPVSYLEFKYKRRVYKSIHLAQKNINLKVNLKKFVESVKNNQISKVSRYLEKGFDPNFHISDDETPLSIACVDLLEPRSMILTLVNGGAHLDFRIRNGGLTSLHKSAISNRKEAIITLLELGASPNVYDEKNLTPLYYTILNKQPETNNDSSYCCLLLLQDHSILNCRDDNSSTELHQACRLGLIQHVEHLLFFRADINAMNHGGNTPLHICAATNQEVCARILLYRGADTTIVNKSNQTPYELALISENHSIALLIQSHKSENVVPFCEIPLINPKRRSIYLEHQRNKHRTRSSSNTTPSSSSLASRSQSMPKFSANNSTIRQSQSPTIEHYFQQQNPSSRSSSPKSFSDQGLGSECTSHFSSNSPNVTNGDYTYKRKRLYAASPGRKCMCIKSYRTNLPGELLMNKGDIVEILSVGENGFLEGKCKDLEGWFPSHHVQDISIFKTGEVIHNDQIVISRDTLSALMINSDSYSPRTIVLQRGKKGFGFVLRGSRVAGKLFQPTPSFPALQFLDSIEKGSNADKAGLKQNDYVLEINDINVISMPHEECVNLIKRAGDTLALKVITANPIPLVHSHYQHIESHFHQQQVASQSLPHRRKAPLRPGLEQQFTVSSSSASKISPFHCLLNSSQSGSLMLKRKEQQKILEDLDRTLNEYEYGTINVSSVETREDYLTMSKSINENSPKIKPLVPERDSSLYETFPSSRTLNRQSPSSPNVRCNSNSSSNEADEESSLSSLNSTHHPSKTDESNSNIYMSPSTTNMSTFKITNSKPSEVKKRSNNRKQTYATLNSNNNNNNNSGNLSENEILSIPPPPPLPENFDLPKKTETAIPLIKSSSDFQNQLEEAKIRLNKCSSPKKTTMKSSSNDSPKTSSFHPNEFKNIIIEDLSPSNAFPPPPSPTTLQRSIASLTPPSTSSVVDPRLDVNFSAVIAQRAAEAKARRCENPIGFEFKSNGLPPSTTFFNNCVTTNGVPKNFSTNDAVRPQRFSTAAHQLLENLKRRGGSTNSSTIGSFVKQCNEQTST